ncbi:DUF443 family protein [Enterococcus wangshanyuanii]|uniref:Tandem five-TM protein n=1 Tax=Enterococcus wangshanyuanii TaxID=2005703 RepID=A0ABQ1NI74_9ENTE|nr:DUF443 family protein [Enterococcus wangshanyuanii]GGC77812.1 hypothetical protein GCM10011573_04330 [Enterococcus wangshanyuanii]
MKFEDTSISRFKLVTINKKDNYLVDLDSHKLTWLFPMATWYLENKAAKIDKKQYEKLKKMPKNKIGASVWSFSGFMLGGVIYALLKGIESIFFEEVTINLILLSFLVAILISFIFRCIRSISNANKLKQIFSKEEMSTFDHLIVLKKDNQFYKKRCITGTIILLAILVFLLSLFIHAKSFTVVPVLFIYLVFVSFLNLSIAKPMDDMEYIDKTVK